MHYVTNHVLPAAPAAVADQSWPASRWSPLFWLLSWRVTSKQIERTIKDPTTSRPMTAGAGVTRACDLHHPDYRDEPVVVSHHQGAQRGMPSSNRGTEVTRQISGEEGERLSLSLAALLTR